MLANKLNYKYAAIGLMQGLVFIALKFFKPTSLLLQSLEFGVYYASIFISLGLLLILQAKPTATQIKQIVVIGLILGAVSLWLFMQQTAATGAPRYNDSTLFSWGFIAILFAYILLPFVQAQSLFKWRSYNYHDLYQHSWDNFFVVSLAGFFLLIYWLLLLLCVALFKMIGIRVVDDILLSPFFLQATMPVMFAVGVGIGLEHKNIIATLRFIALSICRYLLPLSALISVVFAGALLFTGLELLWETGVSTHTLLWLIVVNLIFINGVFQDGANPIKYSAVIKVLINIAIITLTAFALIAVYSVYLRIAQYGLTPRRIYVMVISLVGVVYTVTYAWAAIKSFKTRLNNNWLEEIKRPNVYIAYIVAGLIIVLHIPTLDPLSLSARSQYNRALALTTDPNTFDFGMLFYRLGNPGREYLNKIEQKITELPVQRQEEIKKQLAILKESDSYYKWQRHLRATADGKIARNIISIDENKTLPPGLLSAEGLNNCRFKTCEVLLVDLTQDGKDEAIVFTAGEKFGYARVFIFQLTNKWKHIGNIKRGGKDLSKLIREGKYNVIRPRFNSLAVEGVELPVEIKR